MSDALQPKPVSESVVKTTHLVLPSDTNALGTIFGGRVMAWIDLAAAIAAKRHARQICVTASMDQLDFLQSITMGQIVILQAAVNFTGRTSMEVGVKVEAEEPLTGKRTHTASAYLTFVAIDDEGKAIAVPPVLPETDDEKRRFERAKQRRTQRLRSKR